MEPEPRLSVEWTEDLGRGLAALRESGTIGDIPLEQVDTAAEAEAVLAAAVVASGVPPAGYWVQGTTLVTRRQLRCDTPIFGPLLQSDVLRSGQNFRLPEGVIGAGCSFVFSIARPYPARHEEISLQTISDVVADCRLAIDILGRRVSGSVALNAFTATADFALGVINVQGIRIKDPAADFHLLAEARVTVRINGASVMAGLGADVMAHPLNAVAWLARELKTRGRILEAGDLVSTGSCVGIVQVAPAQIVEADFGELGKVELALE